MKRSTIAGGPYTAVTTVSSPGDLETTGVAGSTCHRVVVAVNSGGESPPSDSVSALFSGDPIIAAVDQLKGDITGAMPLTTEQLVQASQTIKARIPRFGESASTITAVFDLITTFDQVRGALFVTTATGGLTRSAETHDPNWTIYRTMQGIMEWMVFGKDSFFPPVSVAVLSISHAANPFFPSHPFSARVGGIAGARSKA